MSENDKMIYLNTPITTKENDVIGLSVCADKLSDAIDAGAQMIAITSPFGAGKTSVIDLLQEKRSDNKKEHILKIPMWSQLHQLENHTNELHKNFLYQISSLINHKRGTYISRRLSNNYGLLTLHANKQRSWLFFTIALLFGCASWCVNHFSENIETLLPILEDKSAYLTLALALIAIYIGIVVLTRAEIIFSSQKSEKERTIEEDEIIDLYRAEILKHSTGFGNWIRKITKNCKRRPLREHTYIIVVEDLDRTNDGKSVIEFLTELRKYYLPIDYSKSKTAIFKNKVVFIVNIKSESVLLSEIESKQKVAKKAIERNKATDSINEDISYESISTNGENTILDEYMCEAYINEHLFAKIFDYVLDLLTINIVDYETVLEGLLNVKKDTINKLGLQTTGRLIEIPGMLWIVRGQTLDIREIKNRLNKAFLIFETLQNRFPTVKKQISFEKCAMAAYLTTAFEHEFHLTDDVAFQKLIEQDIKHKLDAKSCKEILNTNSDDYVKAVLELMESKLIDDSYRMYFYNYPKDSKIYSYSEELVQKAILYGEESEELDSAIDKVIESNSSIIVNSFGKMKQLKLRLPSLVYLHENLYLQTLTHAENEIILWLDNFDKSTSAIDKNISEILRILRYDSLRKKYSDAQAKRFCDSFEKIFAEDGLLKLRAYLCEQFPNEIIWYKSLFMGVHNIIRSSEMKFLSLTDCINLINVNNDKFGFYEVEYIVNRFCEADNASDTDVDKVKSFLISIKSKIDTIKITKLYLAFMKKINSIIPEFEDTIVEALYLKSDNNEDETFIPSEIQKGIFAEYQELINQVDYEKLSMQTLSNISTIHEFDGYEKYSDNIANSLYTNRFYFDYILISLLKNNKIDLNDTNIYSTIKNSAIWFCLRSKVFRELRIYIIENAYDIISNYSFLFSEKFPIVSEQEFDLIKNRKDIDENNILNLIPVQLVTDTESEFISKYFCRKNQNNNIAFDFLKYIAKMESDIAKLCFESLEYIYSIQYYRFATVKKTTIKNLFKKILNLNTCEGKLRFMETTKCLDSGYESSITDELIDNEDLQGEYIKIVNTNARSITAITLKNLYSFSHIYPMNDLVTERFYKDKKLVRYVVSKTTYHKQFNMDSGERFDTLWPVYVEIFSKNKYTNTCSYMSNNHDFLRLIIKNKEYEGLSEELRIILAKVYQDSNSILNILEYGTKFAIEYFSVIKGFIDYNAANTFVNIVEKNSQILASNEVYENVYEKLVSPPLKSRYTKLRKKSGYKK